MKFDKVARRLRREVEGFDVVFYRRARLNCSARQVKLRNKLINKMTWNDITFLFHWDKFKWAKNKFMIKKEFDNHYNMLNNRWNHYSDMEDKLYRADLNIREI